ncbi:hypothetical protein [Rugosimonospora africana]|nr:hypothetical protein [Rugosimonospora africana]
MSGHAHRRHSTRVVLAAALACALAWLGVAAAATEIGPVPRVVHAGAEVVVIQPSTQHVAQRMAARLGHVRAALISASQRNLAGTVALRVLAIVLAMLFSLGLMRRDPRRRPAVLMHGVRAPPALAAADRVAAAWATSRAPLTVL